MFIDIAFCIQLIYNATAVLSSFEKDGATIAQQHQQQLLDRKRENELILQNKIIQQLHDDVNDEEKNDELTLEQIILWHTNGNFEEDGTMETLLMTHRVFINSLTLLKQLRKRFFVPIPAEYLNDLQKIQEFQNGVQKRIQLKVFKSLRYSVCILYIC